MPRSAEIMLDGDEPDLAARLLTEHYSARLMQALRDAEAPFAVADGACADLVTLGTGITGRTPSMDGMGKSHRARCAWPFRDKGQSDDR